MMPDVDDSFCLTMKGQPEKVFHDFAKKHQMVLYGFYPAIGDLYPMVHTYNRGNFRAAVAFEQTCKGRNSAGQPVYEMGGDPTKPIKLIECWKGTSPEPPGRKEFIGVKM